MFNKGRSLGVPLDEKTYMNLIGYYGKAGTGLFYLNWDGIMIIMDVIFVLRIPLYLDFHVHHFSSFISNVIHIQSRTFFREHLFLVRLSLVHCD